MKKKKKSRYDTPVEQLAVPDYEPPEAQDGSPAPAEEIQVADDTTVFFDEDENELLPAENAPTEEVLAAEEAPVDKTQPAPVASPPAREEERPSLRFRVKTVYRNGKPLAEGTKLAGASKEIRALSEDEGKKKKGKKQKKEKKQKTALAVAQKPGPTPLQEVFGSPDAHSEPKEAERPERPKAKTGMLDYVRYAMLFLCFTVFLYSSYTLIESLVSRAQSRDEYDQLSDSFHAASPFLKDRLLPEYPNAASVDLLSAYVGVQPEEYTPSLRDENAQTKIDKVTFLKNNKNKDTVGWILINGTNIDYPVVNTKDNDYYLRRSFYGKTNLSGTLFTDSRNSKKLMENRNTVIYGHNMNDGSMFNNLHDLKNEPQFQNCTIEIATPNGIFLYEVFSVHEALETSEYFQCTFRNDEHFASWLEEMKGESLYKKEGLELSPGDKILTLSTCMDPIIQSEYRWAVHAKLVEVINYTP